MEEIKQVLGFEVGTALKNISDLGGAVSNLSGRLNRFGTSVDRFNSRFGATSSAMTSTGNAAGQLDSRLGRLTTSAELLSRIVYTQLVIKGLRLTEKAMTDAASEAARLQIELAKVSTVADGMFTGLPDIGAAVRQQSAALGIDQLEIAGGLYQALQNQIGGSKAELLDFNRVASQFAVGTVTSQNNAIELLSGTLNAYGLDVSRAEELASKFNKTIEIGNIEGSQLATVFGRVSTRGSELGVTFEELNGLFATLTIRGVKASEAATQISGVLSAFTKPSEAMKRALDQLNAPSGEFLIRSVGLSEALKQVRDTTDGSSSSLAKLFPNVRALNGASIAARDNLELLNRNIAAVRDTALSLNKERFETIFQTDAKNLENELNKARIELTKFGEELLHVTAEGLKFVGGMDGIISVSKNAAPAIAAVAAATAVYVANTRLAVLQGTALAGVLTKLSQIGLGLGVASSIGNFLGSSLDSSRLENLRKLEAANNQLVSKFVQGEQTRLTEARTTDAAIVQSSLNASRQQIADFNRTTDELIAGEKRLVSVATDQLNRFIGTRESLVRELETSAKDSAKAIEDSQARVRSLTQTKADRQFDASLRDAADPERISRTLSQATSEARKAASALGKAQTDQQISEALRLFDSAERRAESARALAQQTGNRGAENSALSTINRLTDQRIAAEKQLQKIQESRANTLTAEAAKQRQILDSVKANAKELLDNPPTVGLDPQQQAQRAANRQKALGNILKAGFSSSDLKLTDALGLTQLAADMERQPLPISFNIEGAVNQLTAGVQTALNNFKFNAKFDVTGLERALGTTFRSPDEAAAGLSQAVTEADALRTKLSGIEQQRASALTGVKAEVQELLKSTDSFANWLSRSLTVAQPDAQKALALMDQFKAKANSLLDSPNVSVDQVRQLFTSVEQLATLQNKISGPVFGNGAGLNPDIDVLSRATDKLLQVARLPTADPAQSARLEELNRLIQGSNSAATNIETALTRGATALTNAATRIESALTKPINRAFGGLAYHAGGGLARGSDTVPAMLTRGETVMTKSATQRFFSDFQRMNAGMQPQYRNAGGTVTNVGDISINVNESKTPQQTGREIARTLQREFRKGTIQRF
ncbi:Phage-related minor tail protein [Caulifigura coniformis]|uniref:Phage-related minor tail protein n=1 Tax=Caulifigura coniformis TaxID=2527983 RepID=A0A517SHB2_9PLAN|nr:phage tail tape measure protein [Caulifigura coniformis]QDT55516.1 Phage-related minor tail protein [Caulifigura coniformis]